MVYFGPAKHVSIYAAMQQHFVLRMRRMRYVSAMYRDIRLRVVLYPLLLSFATASCLATCRTPWQYCGTSGELNLLL